MKIRNRTGTDKIETQMAPMIDVVFQLLIFFMLTLKIIEPEGNFDINMPLGQPTENNINEDPDLQPLKVRLIADPDTRELAELQLNGRSMGNGPNSFVRLNIEIAKALDRLKAAGPEAIEKQEVEIEPDYNLQYKNITSAISACSGKMTENGTIIRYISKIKFAPIRPQE